MNSALETVIAKLEAVEGDMLRVRDIARCLEVSESTVYSWARRGGFCEGIRTGPAMRWAKEDVIEWVAERNGGRP